VECIGIIRDDKRLWFKYVGVLLSTTLLVLLLTGTIRFVVVIDVDVSLICL
jgi:hypothetical protein